MRYNVLIEINCDTNETLDIDDLVEFQGELKARTAADVNKIIKSIKKHGFSFPFFVWQHDGINSVFDGHGRLMALKSLRDHGEEIPPLPVVYVHAQDEADAKELLLKLNSQYGKMTADSVAEFLDGIVLDPDDLALPEGVLDLNFNIEDEEPEEDEIPEAETEALSKPGEMYELGDSILICGDSTDPDTLARLMGGEKADLVFTDPPYGMKKEKDGVMNDNLNFDDLLEFNRQWIPLTFEHLSAVGSWYCFGIDEPLMDIYSNILKPMIKNNEITFRNLLTWDKGSGQGQNSEDFRMYAVADEKCLFVMKGVQGFNTNQDNYFEAWEPLRAYFDKLIKILNESDDKIAHALGFKCGRTVNHWYSKSQFTLITEENYNNLTAYAHTKPDEIKREYDEIKREYDEIKREYDEIKREYDEIKVAYYETRAYFDNTHDNMNNVWHFSKTSQKEREDTGGHATPKPLELCKRAILTSSRPGGLVLDVFGGSGSTLIAAEMNGRRCRMVELSPIYCDVIRRRYTKWAEANEKPLTSGCLK